MSTVIDGSVLAGIFEKDLILFRKLFGLFQIPQNLSIMIR